MTTTASLSTGEALQDLEAISGLPTRSNVSPRFTTTIGHASNIHGAGELGPALVHGTVTEATLYPG